MKIIIYHGNLDDFNKGPKCFMIAAKTKNTARSLIFSKYAITYRVTHPYQPFFTVPWRFEWRKPKI